MGEFIEALKHFVNIEYETQTTQIRKIWQQPLKARVTEGEAIADVEVVEVTGDRAKLLCRENLSKFREGDRLRLNRGDPEAPPRFSCLLEKDDGLELIVSAAPSRSGFLDLSPGRGWVLDRDVVDLCHVLLGALDTLEYKSEANGNILGILHGPIRPRPNARRERRAARLAEGLKLNQSQHEAFIQAYATENYYLIQGPPGTGKTWVLAFLAVALASEGQRVLVTAFTHRAINNAHRGDRLG